MNGEEEKRLSPVKITTPPSMLARADDIQQQIQDFSDATCSSGDLNSGDAGPDFGPAGAILPNLVWSQLFATFTASICPNSSLDLISLALCLIFTLISQKGTPE